MKNILTTLLVILNSTFFILNSNAANRFWVASSTADWNSTANWSTTSGGSGGASVPGSSDVAKFDGNGTGNCTINATVNVAGIDIASGYSGTIAQGGYSVTVGTSHFAQAGGTWTGGSAKIDVNGGNLTVSGGTFTSTSDTLFIGGSLCGTVTQFNHSGGTFSHNTGTVVFDASGCWPTTQILNVISTTLFNDLVLKPGSSWINVNTASGDTVKAERNIVHLAGTLGGVAFSLQGNFSLGASTGGGSAQVIFAGTANQTYAYTTGGRTAYVVVNKSGGTLSPASGTTAFSSQGFKLLSGTFTAPPGDFFTGGNICSSLAAFTHSGGTFAHNNGRVVLDAYGCWGSSITLDVITATTFYDVKINAAMGSLFPVNIASGDTVKVDNKMEHDGGIINSGCWMLKGNLSIGSSSGGGAAQLIFTGTANQTYTCTTGRTCAVTINKTAGSVTPASGTTAFGVQGFKLLAGSFTAPTGNFKVGGSYCGTMYFTHSSGTFTHNNGTVVFDPSGCWHSYLNIDVLPATAFYNATFSANGSVSVVLTSGDSIDTQHNLILTSCYEMNNALLAPQGNVTVGSAWGTASTTPLLFCGNSDQNFDLTGGTDRFNGSVKIKKTGGKVNLLSAATLDASSQTLTFVKGTIATTSTNLLTLGDNVTVSGVSDSGYVAGPMKKVGNDAFTFPVGKNGHYRKIGISAPSSTTDAYTGEYFEVNSNDTYSHSAKDGSIAELSRNEYWNLARTTGTSNVNVTLSIDSATSCSVDNLSNLKVAAWDGSTWKDKGNGGTSGNTYVGTVVSSGSSSTFGAYTLGTGTGLCCNAITDTILTLSALTLHDTIVHITWIEHPHKPHWKYTLEKSTDGINYYSLASIEKDTAQDIMELEPNEVNPYNGILYSTEVTSGYIFNEKIVDFQELFSSSYRIRLDSACSKIYSAEISPLIYKQVASDLPPLLLAAACPTSETPQPGYINTQITYTTGWGTGCCIKTYTLYASTIPYPECIPGDCGNFLEENGDIKDCEYLCTYDACCLHLGIDRPICQCPAWFPCSGEGLEWVLTTVTDFAAIQIVPVNPIVCVGESVTLSLNPDISDFTNEFPTQNGVAGINWESGGNGGPIISNDPTLTVTPSTTGTYIYGLTLLHPNTCIFLYTCTLTVVPNYTVSISASQDFVCDGGSVTLTASGGVNYLWSTGATTSSIVVTEGGTYTVTDLYGCSNEANVYVTPAPNVTVSGNTLICQGQTVTLHATATQGTPPYTYLWNNSATTPSITVSAGGNYSVTVTDDNGCEVTDDIVATESDNYIPVADFTVSSAGVCVGGEVEFTNNSTGGDLTYLWEFGDGTTSTTEVTAHSYQAPGYYQVVLYAENECGIDLSYQTIFIHSDCCSEPAQANYDFMDLDIETDEVWYTGNIHGQNLTTAKIGGTITVKSGNTLTIGGTAPIYGNCILKFGALGRIVVERGATLQTAYNVVLTKLDDCDVMWQGIEVWGDNTKTHTGTDLNSQGKVLLDGELTIEHAHIGVLLGRRLLCFEPPHLPDEIIFGRLCDRNPWILAYSGGVLLSDYSTGVYFRNNGNDVRFIKYQFHNISKIIITHFIGGNVVNAGYLSTNSYTYPNNHNPWMAAANNLQRTTWGIHNWGVYLTNVLTTNDFDNMEEGIRSFDARYRVQSCEFTNMKYGIRIFNTNSAVSNGHTISGCNFNMIKGLANSAGIEINAGRLEYIGTVNEFGSLDNDFQSDNNIGINMNNCTAYKIEDNDFNQLPVGIKAYGSNQFWSYIRYRNTNKGNTFTRSEYNIIPVTNKRLSIKCNNHLNTQPTDYSGINWLVISNLSNQGHWFTGATSPKLPAGNKFTPENIDARRELLNTGILFPPVPFNYVSHNDLDRKIYYNPATDGPINAIPNNGSPSSTVDFPASNPDLACAPYPILRPVIIHLGEMGEKSLIIDSLQTEFETVKSNLDSGLTQQLFGYIANYQVLSFPLRDTLIACSPLSDTVLLTLLAKRPEFSPQLYKAVLLPNSPLSANVRSVLDPMLADFPQSTADSILAVQVINTGVRTLKHFDNEIEFHVSEKQEILTGLVNRLVDNDSLGHALQVMWEADSLDNGTAQAYISSLTQCDSLSKAGTKLSDYIPQEEADSLWKVFTGIVLDLQNDSLTWFEMDSAQEATIRAIAALCPAPLAGTNAQAVLQLVYGEETDSDPLCGMSGKWDGIQQTQQQEQGQSTEREKKLKLYPNPANHTLNIEYPLNNEEKASIEVFGINGVRVSRIAVNSGQQKTTLSTSHLGQGMYFITFTVNEELKQSEKIIIVHD